MFACLQNCSELCIVIHLCSSKPTSESISIALHTSSYCSLKLGVYARGSPKSRLGGIGMLIAAVAKDRIGWIRSCSYRFLEGHWVIKTANHLIHDLRLSCPYAMTIHERIWRGRSLVWCIIVIGSSSRWHTALVGLILEILSKYSALIIFKCCSNRSCIESFFVHEASARRLVSIDIPIVLTACVALGCVNSWANLGSCGLRTGLADSCRNFTGCRHHWTRFRCVAWANFIHIRGWFTVRIHYIGAGSCKSLWTDTGSTFWQAWCCFLRSITARLLLLRLLTHLRRSHYWEAYTASKFEFFFILCSRWYSATSSLRLCLSWSSYARCLSTSSWSSSNSWRWRHSCSATFKSWSCTISCRCCNICRFLSTACSRWTSYRHGLWFINRRGSFSTTCRSYTSTCHASFNSIIDSLPYGLLLFHSLHLQGSF